MLVSVKLGQAPERRYVVYHKPKLFNTSFFLNFSSYMTLYTSAETKHYLSFLDKFQVPLRAVGGRGRKNRRENRKQKKKEIGRGGKCSHLNCDILHHFFSKFIYCS